MKSRAEVVRDLAEAIDAVEEVARLCDALEKLTGHRIDDVRSMTMAEQNAWDRASKLRELALASLVVAADPYITGEGR